MNDLLTEDPAKSNRTAQIIWITGFSASGKTTVGRWVEALLRERGSAVIFLDGDDLRSIFASRWGYTREERADLARVYFRLCSLLSSQGFTVVISVVAMYEDVRSWLREHIPAAIEVYLDVPEDVRRQRDRATKQIYGHLGSLQDLYDEPWSPDLVVPNHDGVSPEQAAMRIVELALSDRFTRYADHGRREHWRGFYARAQAPREPSTFARLVGAELDPPARLLEVGCGNGRDAAYLAGLGHDVVALDVSETAISTCIEAHPGSGLRFVAGDITTLDAPEASFDVVYSRFSLHAMTFAEEDDLVARSTDLLAAGGRLYIECRSINDPLARKGEVLSQTERIHGHYRRFVVAHALRVKLETAGLPVRRLEESRGVACLGDDDPAVLRVLAERER
ncbi:MAG: adenylyl-sulfate kinase [Solirubrobacteraceae bacterium MAG38_C4-C5]|nr:adenylyl-sulfate kinase [Candidatus Siliceabacter maunaloa]